LSYLGLQYHIIKHERKVKSAFKQGREKMFMITLFSFLR